MPISTPCFSFTTTAALRPLALAVLAVLGTQCQPTTPAGQPAQQTTSPDSLKLETAVATPLPKFDLESPILRQLALLPPAERQIAPEAMRRYQVLTRRFWLAEYSTDYLLEQAQTTPGPPNLVVYARQLAYIQSHWRVLGQGLDQHPPLPPVMTSHLARMQQVEKYQQAALADLQADCAAQRPPRPDAATLATQQTVKELLAPLRREPAPLQVRVQ